MRTFAAVGLLLLVSAAGWWLAVSLGTSPAPAVSGGWYANQGPPTLIDAIELSQQRYAGEVIDAERHSGAARDTGHDLYEIRLLTPRGQVLRIRIDATDGRFLEVDGHGFVEARRP